MATSTSILRRLSLPHFRRCFSSAKAVLAGARDSTAALSDKDRKRAAVALLKSESDPKRIIDICREASLTADSKLDRIAFSVAISKLSDSNCFGDIRCLIEELKRRPDLRNPRFASHSMVLYGQAGMVEDAIATFENLGELGIGRSVEILNSLLFACIFARKYDDARRVFIEFPKKYKISPNLDTYNFMIEALCKSGSTNSACTIVSLMERAGYKPNERTFGTLIEGFYGEEKLEDVGKVLKMMEDHRMKPGLWVFNMRIKCLCKLKKSVEAKALLDSMLSRGMGVNVTSYDYLIHGFCKEGNLKEAKMLLKSMVARGYEPDGNCYFTMIYFLCKGGDYEAALQMFKECMRNNWVPNFSTTKLLVQGLAGVSRVDEAREVIKEVKDKFPSRAKLWKETEDSLPS